MPVDKIVTSKMIFALSNLIGKGYY
jgi:hypothetical protein